MIRNIKLLLFLLILGLPVSSFAHDGHGFFHGSAIEHYMTSPTHAIPGFAIVIACILVFRFWKNRSHIST